MHFEGWSYISKSQISFIYTYILYSEWYIILLSRAMKSPTLKYGSFFYLNFWFLGEISPLILLTLFILCVQKPCRHLWLMWVSAISNRASIICIWLFQFCFSKPFVFCILLTYATKIVFITDSLAPTSILKQSGNIS